MKIWTCCIFVLAIILEPTFGHGLCWKPGLNPFTGAPTAERLDATSVRIDWSNIFTDGHGCEDVDFIIKSHPRFQPSAYKLSDFTLKGQRKAVLQIDGNTDYVFQVIAREDKGPQHGIDYKYSKMVNSYATDLEGSQTGPIQRAPPPPPPPPPPAPTRPVRVYRPPQTRSMGSIYDDYALTTSKPKTSSNVNTAIAKCLPSLRKEPGFGHGSKMQKDRILINFIRYMNQRPLEQISGFLQTKKSCKESHKKGFVIQCQGRDTCCSTPWAKCEDCYDDFGLCDGRCIPQEWMNDGWPDCMDGSDDADMRSKNGKSPAFQLQCVECAGVVLSAAHLCHSSGRGLTDECVNTMIGEGECNVCVQEFLN